MFSSNNNNQSATSLAPSVVGTPEIEARDFRQDFIDQSNSFWGKTLNQALSIFKTSQQDELDTDETDSHGRTYPMSMMNKNTNTNNVNTSAGQPLNAYLTYVSLPLTLIMQGNDDDDQIKHSKSLKKII
jgi:hypothetical protein